MSSTPIDRVLEPARTLLTTATRTVREAVEPYVDQPPAFDTALRREDGRIVGTIQVHLPHRDVVLEAHAADPTEVAAELSDALGRLADRFRVEVDRPLRRRLAERAERVRPAPVASARARLEVELPALRRAARHEVDAARAEHDLPVGWLDGDEILDEAIARVLALGNAVAALDAPELAERVQLTLIEAVHDEVARAEEERARLASLDLSTRELDPAEAMVTLGDELQATAAWPRDLAIRDVLGDSTQRDPEAIADDREARRQLVRALFSLPRDARRIFEEVVLDEHAADTVARMHGRTEREVDDQVVATARRLADLLSRSRVVDPAEVLRVYGRLGRTLRSELSGARREAMSQRVAEA